MLASAPLGLSMAARRSMMTMQRSTSFQKSVSVPDLAPVNQVFGPGPKRTLATDNSKLSLEGQSDAKKVKASDKESLAETSEAQQKKPQKKAT